MKCPNCAHDNSTTARFCENCGQALPRTCPNCGGNLERRPVRPVELLHRHPASTTRVVADTALGGRRVSGVFDTSRLDEALASIARELGARTAAVPPFVTLLY